MKAFITGATGFIGKALCKELLQRGAEVTAVSRDAVRAQATLGNNVRCTEWSRANEWKSAIYAADTIFHLAGENVAENKWNPEVKERLLQSRIGTAQQIVNAMREAAARPKVLVSASGISYYGNGGENELSEASPSGGGFLAELSRGWEAAVGEAESLGVRVVQMRVSIVLGKGGALEKILYPLPVRISPWYLGVGGALGTGKQWFPWIHLEDTVGMFIWAAEKEEVRGAVNVVAPELIRNSRFSEVIGKIIQRPSLFPTPKLLLRLIAGEIADELLYSQKALPSVAQKYGFVYRYPDIEGALRSILCKNHVSAENG